MGTNPENFKNPPLEPKKNSLRLVQELCAMEVYSFNQKKTIPLIEALKEEERMLLDLIDDAPPISPDELIDSYGRDDIYPAVKALIAALDTYVGGHKSSQDEQVIIESPSVFQALAQNLYYIVDGGLETDTAREEIERDEFLLEDEKNDLIMGELLIGNAASDDESTLREARDWKNVKAKAEQVAAALKSDIGMDSV
jgi:hypothetical protein